MHKVFIAHIALLAANFIFGMNYHIAKGLMPDHLTPFQVIFIRATIAIIVFWSLKFFTYKERVKTKDLLRLALCGVLGIAVNQIMFFKGLNLTKPVDASVIMISNPIIALIFANILVREKITIRKITGIVLGGTGAFLMITYGKNISFSTDHMLGNFFILINTSAYAMYLVLVKSLMMKYHPITVMKWIFLFGYIIIIPVTIKDIPKVEWAEFTTGVWLSILYVVFGTTIVAYLLNSFALKTLNSSVASFYMYFQPLVAGVVSYIKGYSPLQTVKIVSALLIFTGVFLVTRQRKGAEKKKL